MQIITKTHQWWHVARKNLPVFEHDGEKSSLLSKIWNVKKNQPYRWAANPKTNGDTCSNPFDLLKKTFDELVEVGERNFVGNGLRLLAEDYGFGVIDREARSDRGSVVLELMDTQEQVGIFAAHLRETLSGGINSDEKKELLAIVHNMEHQLHELVDALKNGDEVAK